MSGGGNVLTEKDFKKGREKKRGMGVREWGGGSGSGGGGGRIFGLWSTEPGGVLKGRN